jgi:glycosyltransferase involved in cell wall biosynthesis
VQGSLDIWIWQRIISPHVAGMAVALAQCGHRVTYCVERAISSERAAQGWEAPHLPDVRLIFAATAREAEEAAALAPTHSIHLCQGIRSNGVVGAAQRVLRSRRLAWWVFMEAVQDTGPAGWVKRLVYRNLFKRSLPTLHGVLAIGWRTEEWVIRRGVPHEKVFPFAYFPQEREILPGRGAAKDPRFCFLFVGRFVKLKRFDFLVDALAKIRDAGHPQFRLLAIGSGPLEDWARMYAERRLGTCVKWLGRRPMGEVRSLMGRADCLVLPSSYDGWGAVASEALMAGTPTIVSDACGSAGAVKASGVGGVFPAFNSTAFAQLLESALSSGPVQSNARERLASWASCLAASSGAAYVTQIFAHAYFGATRPKAPWETEVGTTNGSSE